MWTSYGLILITGPGIIEYLMHLAPGESHTVLFVILKQFPGIFPTLSDFRVSMPAMGLSSQWLDRVSETSTDTHRGLNCLSCYEWLKSQAKMG